MRRPAFTLLEVIIALSIAVSLMAITWPTMRNAAGRATLREAAMQLKSGLADARDLAVRSGVVIRVTFEQNGSVFHITKARNELLNEDDLIDLSVTQDDPALEPEDDEEFVEPSPVSHELPGPVTFESSDPNTSADELADEDDFEQQDLITIGDDVEAEATMEQCIEFFPDGRGSSATIRLGSSDTNDSVTVTVRALTGGVTIGQIEHEEPDDDGVAEVEYCDDMEEVAEMEQLSDGPSIDEWEPLYQHEPAVEEADEVWLPSFIDQAED